MYDYEIAVIQKAYDKGIIEMQKYVAIEKFAKIIDWQKISSKYGVKRGFKQIARKLVKRKLLSDDGKSMAVLYLTKLGIDYITGMIEDKSSRISKISTDIP